MEIAVTGRPRADAAPAARLRAGSAIAVPLFGTAMLLSGFLLFLIEPMVARMVLPILGGVPMVWNGCVVFFQIVMLAGYGYAFAASRWLDVRRHVPLHAALLLAPAAVLPVMIRAGAVDPPAGNPLGWLLLLLAATIGLPFFVLSTTASVLQHWLSQTDHPSGRDPYFLYAASNVGCLLALASYPVIVEPALTLHDQSRLWSIGYGAFVVLAGACGVYAWCRRAEGQAGESAIASRPAPLTAGRRGRWVALAFVPSSLMLAVTSYVSTDIAAVPLLWILPLALYLLTFALAFGRASAAAASTAQRALPLAVAPLALFMIARVREPFVIILALHLGAFAAIAFYCHTALAADRPHRAQLTEFYFWLSFGGMLGGLFNTLLAPLLFDSVAEYPLAVMLAALLFRFPGSNAPPRQMRTLALPVAACAISAAVLVLSRTFSIPLSVQLTALAVPALLAFSQ